MKADGRREGIEGVGEPLIQLNRGGGEWGRRDTEAFDQVFQAVPVSLVPHGAGGELD